MNASTQINHDAEVPPPSDGPVSGAPLIDPATKFPKPPYPDQRQAWPGLACKMHPRPDHGESTYKGSGRLLNRKALITGGDSGMGRAAAIAYAREGADVAINYYPDEEPDAEEVLGLIRQAGRVGVAVPGDIREEKTCQGIVARAARELGGLDILVSNAGRQQAHESILEISSDEFDATMKTNVYAPFCDDDHLRNHAFIWDPPGKAWRLSPLYDVVPHPQVSQERRLHLSVGPEGRSATLTNLFEARGSFGLLKPAAIAVIERVSARVREWRTRLEAAGVSPAQCDLVQTAFRRPRDIGLDHITKDAAAA